MRWMKLKTNIKGYFVHQLNDIGLNALQVR